MSVQTGQRTQSQGWDWMGLEISEENEHHSAMAILISKGTTVRVSTREIFKATHC